MVVPTRGSRYQGLCRRTQLAKPLLWLQKTVPNLGEYAREVLGIAWG